ncbi:MAG: CD1247 N-terminal domain-containing protein [Veillonellales bacterium]
MGNMKEKVAYLQGLTRGLNVSDTSSEGKLLLNIVDVMDDMAEEFDNMNSVQEDLGNYVETIDEDLTDLEEEIYEETYEDDEFIEVECPFCHEAVAFESELLDEKDAVEVTCPHCGEVVYDNAIDEDDIDVNDSSVENEFRHGLHPGI